MGRLNPYMSKLVSSYQTGFVPGRSIHENIIIAKEIMHRMNKKRERKAFLPLRLIWQKLMISLIGSLFGGPWLRLVFLRI